MPISAADERQVTASMRNWLRMSRPRAPRALRMPISRVRSRTETSMMFMIPIPPTTSAIEAMPPSSSVSVPLIVEAACSSWVWSKIWKSSLSVAPMPCRTRRSSAIWSRTGLHVGPVGDAHPDRADAAPARRSTSNRAERDEHLVVGVLEPAPPFGWRMPATSKGCPRSGRSTRWPRPRAPGCWRPSRRARRAQRSDRPRRSGRCPARRRRRGPARSRRGADDRGRRRVGRAGRHAPWVSISGATAARPSMPAIAVASSRVRVPVVDRPVGLIVRRFVPRLLSCSVIAPSCRGRR